VFCRLPPAEFQSLPPTAVPVAVPSSTVTTATATAPAVLVIRFIEPSDRMEGAQAEDRYREVTMNVPLASSALL
jgi:hypothetical protein